MILIIKYRPKTNANMEKIFNLSIEINGIGIVSAKYKEIKELFTKKKSFILFNHLIRPFQSGKLKLFIFNFEPIL